MLLATNNRSKQNLRKY